ncbi:MAG: hypothetical protein KDC90_06595, partial [Ignavibacteriae bacterium]|nr:hypothetical protein [Ignavibacteriota bacterium]
MKIIIHYLQKVYIVLILLLVILSSKHTFAQVAAQDSLALVALYNSTGGPNWTNNTNWLNGPVSTWAGINVIDGHVYTIELINNNLSGNIPTDIGNLTGLRNLILDDNKLTGEIPSQISQLSELSVLTLSHNQMTGNLPAGLGNQNMTNLSLEFNKFTGPIPAEAGTWEFLYYLVVNDNQFTSLPNLTGLPLGSLVTVQNNKFEFDDLEPNIGVLHTYAPQDSIGLAQQKTVKYYEQLLITSNTGGTQNTYKWYKNDVLINGQTSANLIIQNVALNDAGIYKVEVKNNLVTDLTLYGRPINVQIDGSILGLSITKPENNEKWIAGETNTIRWTGGRADQSLAIAYSIDEGKTFQTLDFVYPANIGNAVWHIPDSLLTTRARIRIYDFATAEILDESENFRIKPYIITKIIKGTNGIETYRAYNNKLDKWGFGNTQAEMWPEVGWYSTWDYQTGIDPFIDKVYDQDVGDGVFKNAKSSEFTDWSSYVKAFGEHNCYWYGFIYSFIATENWKAKKSSWGGSCFGIAAANAIAFEDSVEFRANFPNFPTFVTPSTVKPDNLVRMAITQLFSHQLGNPNETIRSVAYNTSPTQTIRDLKKMLKEDNVKIRNLLFWSNDTSNPGGHAINVYKLEQNPDTLELFTVYVWDNSYPNSLKAKIIVDTSANNGKGSWEPKYAWSTWGGYYHFGLDLPATTYLNNSSLTKTNMKQTPFLLDENELKVYNTPSANIEIKDNLGNVTGFGGSGVMSNIPNSVPLIFLNGSTGPPYGYLLPKNNYSIKMNNFKNDTVNTFVFTGNKIFEYERSAATNNQTDNLFFDGGMSVSNPN